MSPKRNKFFAVFFILLFVGILAGCAPLTGPETVQVTVVVNDDVEGEPVVETIIVTEEVVLETPLPTPTPSDLAPEVSAPPTIKETRRLVLEWPPTMRKGDANLIRITLEMDEDGEITPTVEIEGHESSGIAVTIPDLYDSHIVKVKPQLNLSGIAFSPAVQTEKTLRRGENVSFYWSVHPDAEGDYLGAVSFQLSFIPKDGGQTTTISLSEQIFEIRVKTLGGMSGRTVRIVGWVFSLLGAIVSLDDIIKFIKKRFEDENAE